MVLIEGLQVHTTRDGVTVSCDVVCDLNLWLSYCLFGHVCLMCIYVKIEKL